MVQELSLVCLNALFERDSKVVSHPNNYKSGEVTVIEPRSFSEAAQIVKN